MKRDHLLGWPPALLALDPEPTPPRVIYRTLQSLTDAEQRTRAEQDQMITAQLPVLKPEPKTKSAVQYFIRHVSLGDAYRETPDGVLQIWQRSQRRWLNSRWNKQQALELRKPIVPVDHKPEWVTADE